jgi:glycosyltransferase involved in cell wall biosynthesis
VLPLFGRRESASLIHTTPDHGCFFKRRGVPLVLTFHGFVLDEFISSYSTPAQRIYYRMALRWFTRLSLGMAARVTSVSCYMAGLVRRELNYDSDITVIYNGVDTARFIPAERKNGQGQIRVLFSGNLSRRKGIDLLPSIAERLSPGIEILYTRGLRKGISLPPSKRLRDIGSIPYGSMPAVYQGADILLFPTVREGFGLAAVEAMACGLPVVATKCSSLPEIIIDGKGGFLCDPGDTRAFAERINHLADSPTLRREMGVFNRHRAESLFSMERMIEKYRDLFREVLR